MRVSGLTIIKASLQGKNRDHKTKEKRAAAGALAGWNSVFLVEGKLLAQEQYFGTQGSPGRKCQSQEMGGH